MFLERGQAWRRAGRCSVVVVLAFCPAAFASSSVYVTGTLPSGAVSQYTIAADGALSPKTPASVAAPGASFSTRKGIAASRDGRSVYVLAGSDILQYSVAADGTLSPKTPAAVATGGSTFAIAVSPDGKSVYVLAGSGVLQYSVAADGTLSPTGAGVVAAGLNPTAISLSPDGTSAYVTNRGNSPFSDFSVSQYTVAPDGTLSPKSPATVATQENPSAIAVTPDGRSAYVTTGLAFGMVSQYTIAADGTLSPKSPAFVYTGTAGSFDHQFASAITVSPDGRSAYVANEDSSTVAQFTIAGDGSLYPKTPLIVNVPGTPQGIGLSPDAKSAYIVLRIADAVAQYTIAADGTLAPKTPATVSTVGLFAGSLVSSTDPPAATRPTCAVTAVRRPGRSGSAEQDVTVADPGGLTSIAKVQVSNGAVFLGGFGGTRIDNVASTPLTGAPTSVVLTAVKTTAGTRTVWSFDVTNTTGSTVHCA